MFSFFFFMQYNLNWVLRDLATSGRINIFVFLWCTSIDRWFIRANLRIHSRCRNLTSFDFLFDLTWQNPRLGIFEGKTDMNGEKSVRIQQFIFYINWKTLCHSCSVRTALINCTLLIYLQSGSACHCAGHSSSPCNKENTHCNEFSK